MRPLPQFLLTTALVAAAGLGGYYLGHSEPHAQDGGAAPAQKADGEPAANTAREAGVPGASTGAFETVVDAAQQRRGRILKALLDAMQSDRSWRKAANAADELALEDIPAALEMAKKAGRRGASILLPPILSRWAELDPPAAANFALTLKGLDRYERQSALSTAAAEWAKRDPKAAQAWVLTLSDSAQARTAVQGLASGLGERDPAAALAWLGSLPAALRTIDTYDRVFREWTTRDPQGAAQQALALPGGVARSRALSSVAQNWAAKDPEAAYAWIQQIPEPGLRARAASTILAEWAKADPEAAAAEALKLPGSTRNLPSLVANVAERDIDAALKLIDQIPEGPDRTQAFQLAQEQLGHYNPKAAAEMALTWKPGDWQNRMLQNSLLNLAREVPAEALEFISQHVSETVPRKQAEQAALYTWSQSDPQAAMEWMLKNGRNAPEDLAMAVQGWSQQDPTAALAWARSQPAGPARNQTESAALAGLALADPPRAAAELAQLSEGESKRATAVNVAGMWARQDPRAAAQWASQLADQATNSDALRTVAQAWSSEDAGQAAGWLKSLPAGPGRDSAIEGYAKALAWVDPGATIAWAESISAAPLREETLKTTYEGWKNLDAKAASQWLATTKALSAETIQKWKK